MTKSQSLERGIHLLELLNESEQSKGTRELARDLGLSPAIVQRLINTLAEHDYIQQNPETKRYRIGYRTLVYRAPLMRRDGLMVATRQELEEVARRLRVDCFLASLQGRQAVYMMCMAGGGPISVKSEPGETMPLHSTAIGKCLLAASSDEEARLLIGPGPLQAVTTKTITDPELLMQDVALTRTRGYAVVENENIDGIISVGTGLNAPHSSVKMAISLSFSPHFTKNVDLEEAVAVITAAARRIGRATAADAAA